MSKEGPQKSFLVEYLEKPTRAQCKHCKNPFNLTELRIGRISSSEKAKSTHWYHSKCIFKSFGGQRRTTKRIESPEDIAGWNLLKEPNKESVLKMIEKLKRDFEKKTNKPLTCYDDNSSVCSENSMREGHKDNSFKEFRKVVSNVYFAKSKDKIKVFRNMFSLGSDKTGFKGDLHLWCKLLLPSLADFKRVYNLDTQQLKEIFSKIFHIDRDSIQNYIDTETASDIGQTVEHFFENNSKFSPAKNSTLSLYDVDEFLEKLAKLTKEEDRCKHFKSIISKCTGHDLKVILRLVVHDLRMKSGVNHILEAIHPNACSVFDNKKSFKDVLKAFWTPEVDRNLDSAKVKIKVEEITPRITTEGKSLKRVKQEVNSTPIKKRRHIIIKEEKVKFEVKLEVEEEVLPKYFENIKLLLEDGILNWHKGVIDLFKAHGGTVLDKNQSENATHVVHVRDTIEEITVECSNRRARHVIIEWIKDSISEKGLKQDTRPYTVRLKSKVLNK